MKEDKFLEMDFSDLDINFPFSRRKFLQGLGAGIIILFTFGDSSILQAQERRRRRFEYPSDFNAYLRIGEDGRVSCLTGKIEMGQGIITSLAQMLADELDVPLDAVDMVMGDTDLCPWDMGTFGSMSTRFFGPPLRAAAAEARAILITLAAEHLNLPVSQMKTEAGIIYDKENSENRVTYAQLAKGKKIERLLEEKPPVKDFSEFKIMNTPVFRRDAPDKVSGKAEYAGDVRLPGMLYATILRPPAHGATLKSVDTSAAEKIEGVQIVKDGDFVAVLHLHPDVAEKAIKRVKAQYDMPESNVDDKTIFKHLLSVAPKGEIVSSGGHLLDGRKLAHITFEHKYFNSYVAHATIETHTASAQIESGKITIWASTQTPFRLKEEVANRLGFPTQNVRVITPFVGGGFGGKTRNQQGVEAARLAKLTGKPVHVAWSRAEEFFHDAFRPAAVVKITSGVTNSGRIALWDYGVYFAGQRGSEHFYDIPHHRTMVHGSGWVGPPGSHPFDTGPWRAPANNTNTFARESQIDIMAVKAGMDPLEFRLKNLKDKKMIGVLRAAAEKFNWTPAKTRSGRGYGIACGIDVGTYVAHMAEVEVNNQSGHVQVKRVVCAQDMGLAVNPQGAKLQIEGCITMGIGYALTEEVHFKGGEILDLNFDTYEITRFSGTPKIDTVLIGGADSAPQGGGEPAIICMGAVVANAIFDATGARLFQLPMIPERIREALQRG
ncbi:MAG: molybdopterin-dependent oxidoreductase [Candidatus Latescibacteria bacterium]|nr:molybdopterin-dependent oxidoreductase [Candidatus Latescibacterota bacterium]NIO56135.1 molybdopterin-dependent oxidoreductase [Candidatus Latescibacterota bacterium]